MDSLDISMDTEEETAVIQYIVKEGDTLSSIATTF
ncbi:LysM peptidoglycan-binding domain-containing protein [bacterium]|nr:LysM peptidoglycan-binding domain-containing protein [bacterium]